jgi:hypothetical protein
MAGARARGQPIGTIGAIGIEVFLAEDTGLMPDLGTWIGASIIVCAGVFIALAATRGPRLG